MKTQFNLTTCACDLDRFASREDFLSLLNGFDGVELMVYETDVRGIVQPCDVTGLHMRCPFFWLDFWNGDIERCTNEFVTMENAYAYYGGRTRQVFIDSFRADLAEARRYDAAYMVFHVADSCPSESMTGRYTHTDEAVIDATCALINAAMEGISDGPMLLLENLWSPGLTLTRPAMTERLLAGIRYPHVGLMLDTGHLMHTDPSLRTQKEALDYIHRRLDEHGELCKYIRGIHLNQSLTGAYMKRVQEKPPVLSEDFDKRMAQFYEYAFRIDRHKPFTCPGVAGLIERISPDWLTYEFISNDLRQFQTMLNRQQRALKRGVIA